MKLNKENADFYTLWDNYPRFNDDRYGVCLDKYGNPNLDSQCAMRFSTMLHRCGFDTSSFRGVKCWFGCSEPHFLRVEELDKWLVKQLGKPEVFRHTSYDDFPDKQGIVIFLDFWARKEGGALTGDHADIFNSNELANGSLDYFERSREIHFWGID
jgi:hypothetical protein